MTTNKLFQACLATLLCIGSITFAWFSSSSAQSLIPSGYSTYDIPGGKVAVSPHREDDVRLIEVSLGNARKHVHSLLPELPSDAIITIIIAPNQRALHQAQPVPENVPPWAIGTAYPEQNLITLAPPDDWASTPIRVNQTMIHEYSHLAFWNATRPYSAPRWLDEGIALYLAGESDLRGTMTLTIAAALGNLHPFETITHSFPRDKNRAIVAYYQSVSFVNYFIDNYGMMGMRRLIDNLADGKSIDDACRATTGLPFFIIEREWRKSIRFWYNWVPVIVTLFNTWILITFLFLYTYARKRRRTSSALKRMAEEEKFFYGTRDDTDDYDENNDDNDYGDSGSTPPHRYLH